MPVPVPVPPLFLQSMNRIRKARAELLGFISESMREQNIEFIDYMQQLRVHIAQDPAGMAAAHRAGESQLDQGSSMQPPGHVTFQDDE